MNGLSRVDNIPLEKESLNNSRPGAVFFRALGGWLPVLPKHGTLYRRDAETYSFWHGPILKSKTFEYTSISGVRGLRFLAGWRRRQAKRDHARNPWRGHCTRTASFGHNFRIGCQFPVLRQSASRIGAPCQRQARTLSGQTVVRTSFSKAPETLPASICH